ncbi:MAG TPA: dTDP-4-dehydrorhamnose reductase [Armatimonadota bacterium]|nr:dTDP-4-dehydrorhamnose reductase [Armatimonadota bacterium]
MRVMVTGAKGMLGGDLCEVLDPAHEVIRADLDDFDITEAKEARRALAAARPQMVIHCAAWTDVDGCERNPERAFQQNARGTWNVAAAATGVGASLVYMSTDFVFDGAKGEPYTEFDPPNPINVYGASKLAGEEAVRRLVPQHYILRTAWLFGRRGRHFVSAILKAAAEREEIDVVADQFGSPTYARDLARAIADLVVTGRLFPGTCHLVNSGVCSWAELAGEALRAAGSQARVHPIPAAEWPSPAHRPAYSALRSRWLEIQGLPAMRDWREAVRSYVEEAV